MKNCNDSNGNRTRDRTTCRAEPPRTASQCRITPIMDPKLTLGSRVSILYVYGVPLNTDLLLGKDFCWSVKINALWGSKQLKLRNSDSRFCQQFQFGRDTSNNHFCPAVFVQKFCRHCVADIQFGQFEGFHQHFKSYNRDTGTELHQQYPVTLPQHTTS